ncbi:MAG: family 20 glycosylhydrolase, partial [Acidobacteriia bacterium]|nr:family 20 glycosylhydrolase [Terriglobia bacterium]
MPSPSHSSNVTGPASMEGGGTFSWVGRLKEAIHLLAKASPDPVKVAVPLICSPRSLPWYRAVTPASGPSLSTRVMATPLTSKRTMVILATAPFSQRPSNSWPLSVAPVQVQFPQISTFSGTVWHSLTNFGMAGASRSGGALDSAGGGAAGGVFWAAAYCMPACRTIARHTSFTARKMDMGSSIGTSEERNMAGRLRYRYMPLFLHKPHGRFSIASAGGDSFWHDRVEFCQLFGGQGYLHCAGVLFEIFAALGAHQSDGEFVLRQHPGQGQLRCGAALAFRHFFDLVHQFQMWGEVITPETIDSRIWPRTAAMAERFWSPRTVADLGDMYRRL